MSDLIPRSRLDAVEQELQAAELKLLKVQAAAADEIERLTAELFTMRNIFHEQDTRIAELEVARAYWYCENCGCHNCLVAEEFSNEGDSEVETKC